MVLMMGFVFVLSNYPISFAGDSKIKTPAERYFDLVDQAMDCTQAQMVRITASAEQAAKIVVSGGRILSGGSQDGFFVESFSRAGGLMGLKRFGRRIPPENTVVLYAAPGVLTSKDAEMIKKLRENKVMVVVFATDKSAGKDVKTTSNGIIDSGSGFNLKVGDKICPVDTVSNVINLWVWTGEFVAACTRAGKMPAMYESVGMPNGRTRNGKYSREKIFHDDVKVKPVVAGVLGKAYLTEIRNILKSVRKNEIHAIKQTADIWKRYPSDKVLIVGTGHLFPYNLKDPRAPQRGIAIQGNHEEEINDDLVIPDFVLFVGYQFPPELLLEQMREIPFKMVYFTVKPGKQNKSAIYFNPRWPMTDSCVKVPGYDVPICPSSGVIDAVIYWAIMAQMEKK